MIANNKAKRAAARAIKKTKKEKENRLKPLNKALNEIKKQKEKNRHEFCVAADFVCVSMFKCLE